jgi:uroporphyrinogen-III synthase
MPTILLTRPKASSEQLAHELRRLGYNCVIEPLLSIAPTSVPQPDVKNIQAVMITSANVLGVLIAGQIQNLLGLPCFCVGPSTAEKARAFGFQTVENSAGDGLELAQLIGHMLNDKNRPILHIAGRDIDSGAHDELQRMGFMVTTWPVYAAIPATALTPATIEALQQKKLDAILLFSTRTAETLKLLLLRHGLGNCCQKLVTIGLSEAVIDVLKPIAWRKLVAAQTPAEDSVIAALKEILPVS